MHRQSGNFLLQALLALTLIFAFVPFIARRMAGRDMNAQMYAATHQIELAATAARIFITENADNIPYDITVISGNAFADTLEQYGLPLGFVARTALGQDMALVINKTPDKISAHLELSGGDLTGLRMAELAQRIGFGAAPSDGGINVEIALGDNYTDIVRRVATGADENTFLTNLNMGGFSFINGGGVVARRGEFDSAQSNIVTVFGVENGRKVRNEIAQMSADKTIFQSGAGVDAALSLTRGTLMVGDMDAKTIARFGDSGNFTSDVAAVYDFSMTAGRNGFSGPSTWNVYGNVVSDRINFSVERLDVSGYINATRGQDVYINPDDLEYSTRSGIEVGTISASNITLRDQTSDALNAGKDGAVILDLRPAGTSVLPDVLVDDIDNNAFGIISRPADDNGKTVDCKSIIASLGGRYNQKSLSQYIVCQYVYWQRLEKRIDIKKCMMDGRGGCY